jgi:hypothetical protein
MPWVKNVPKEPLRWTLARASSEFQVSIPTLTTKLNQANQVSAADRSFTTRQLVESLYGNVHAERLRNMLNLDRVSGQRFSNPLLQFLEIEPLVLSKTSA